MKNYPLFLIKKQYGRVNLRFKKYTDALEFACEVMEGAPKFITVSDYYEKFTLVTIDEEMFDEIKHKYGFIVEDRDD